MIMGWLEHGRTDRWVLLDMLYPTLALHDGRATLRQWADWQNRERALRHTPGPRRMPAPCKSAVKTSGAVQMVVWPCQVYGQPRRWTEGDGVWRPVLEELAAYMATVVACDVRIDWMGGGEPVLRARSEAGLAGMGFLGAKRGEPIPRNESPPPPPDGISFKVSGANLGVMPQGDAAWH